MTLETVTPLFLGGADPRGAPELRAPSFRGALRYWLRAALGGVYGDNATGLSQVRRIEAQIFGSTDEKAGGASAIAVRIPSSHQLSSIPYSQIAAWNAQQKEFQKLGVAYLFFAARRTRAERERSALLGTFELILQMRPKAGTDRCFEKAYAALWLLTHFGGVGNRAHRCGGNLQVVSVQGRDINPDLVIAATSSEGLAEELKAGLHSIKSLLETEGWAKVHNPSEFDILHPEVCQIWVAGKTYERWDDAVDEIGRILKSFRNRRQPDYETVKKAMMNQQPLDPAVERAAFGLPIPFYYRSLHDGATLRSTHFERRSSPLWIRAVKLADGRYTLVFLWFRSRFLPPEEKLTLQKEDNVLSEGPLPGDDLLPLLLKRVSLLEVSL